MYQLDIQKQTISIEGERYSPYDFDSKRLPAFASQSDYHNELFLFLKDWFSPSPYLTVQTSGSTGQPKEIQVEKSRMMQSAQLTCSFLGLKEGDSALLCMSLKYIAGKMMVIRALVAGLDLYLAEPSGNPLRNIDKPFNFVAMIPMQVYNSLTSVEEMKRIKAVKNLIIGGGAIDRELRDKLKSFPNNVYSTYGMTETLSHIAMQKLSGEDTSGSYMPFESVSLSLSEDSALIIDAPLVATERLYTNDIAQIHTDGSFNIIGRRDNIINSGGIKIQIEEVEQQLQPYADRPFAITSLPNPKFGEIVVLVVEGHMDEQAFAALPEYHRPKRVIHIDAIPLTETGKVNRAELRKWVRSKYS